MFPALSLLAALAHIQATPVTLEPGDVIRIELFGYGEPIAHTVLEDGSVSGSPYGRIVVSGKTVEQVAKLVEEKSKKYLNKPVAFVSIVQKVEKFVFLAGNEKRGGKITWKKGLDLRSIVTVADAPANFDQMEVRVFRKGKEILKANVLSLLAGKSDELNPQLQPDDVITFLPIPLVRAWVVDKFASPGEYSIPEGSSLSQLIARAGGPVLTPPPNIQINEADFERKSKIRVIRGGQQLDFDPFDKTKLGEFKIQNGDTVTVSTPKINTITVAGFINAPGKQFVLENTDIVDVIAQAQGPTENATLDGVIVRRGSEVLSIDLSNKLEGENSDPFYLKDGDMIVVRENKDYIYVLGEVNAPGKFIVKDGEALRATDAVAKAGGITDQATYRRVMLARKGESGKYEVIQFNLDEFLKDGKLESNPELKPGDFLLFNQSRGVTVDTFLQLLPTAVLIQSLSK